MRQKSDGFSPVALILVIVVAFVIGFIGLLVFSTPREEGSSGLVPLDNPDKGKVKEQPEDVAPDAAPAGFKTYNNPKLGFSFAYPEAWGELRESADPATVLNLNSDKVAAYSLTGALQVQ